MKDVMIIGPAVLCALLAGCASVPPPTGRLEVTAAAIRAAQHAGAESLPEAAQHLQRAKEQAEQARALTGEGQAERAGYVLQRAEADAELATVLAKKKAARAQAEQAAERLRALERGEP
jgi:regulator of protease activity HflC (stomatin/prohibitin superfamily)